VKSMRLVGVIAAAAAIASLGLGCSGGKPRGGPSGDAGAQGDGKDPSAGGDQTGTPTTPDTTAPDLVSVTAAAHVSVQVVFSEALAAESVLPASFHIQGPDGTITIEQAILRGDGLSVDLIVAAGMRHGHSYTLLVSGVTDLAGNAMSNVTRDFLGRGAVAAALTNLPLALSNVVSGAVSVAGDDIVAYRVRLATPTDPGAFGDETPVATPIALAAMSDGAYQLDVIGKDSLGNWQPEVNATHATWVVDVTAPVATYTATPPAITSAREATFTVGGATVVAYAYALDGAAFSAEAVASAAIDFTLLLAGPHTLNVVGRDAAGNWQAQASATTFSWYIDYVLPVATLGTPPGNPTAQTGASFTVGGSGVLAYSYRVDGGAWSSEAAVSDPLALTGLGEGPHTLDVVGKDIYDGWQLATSATSFSWTIDLTAPTAQLRNTPPLLTSETTIACDVTDTVGGADAAFYRYALDGGAFSADPIAITVPLTASALSALPTDNPHVLLVVVGDRTGNWQLEGNATAFTWTIDTQAKTAVLFGLPAFYSASDSGTLTVGGAGIAAYRFDLDGAGFGSEFLVGATIDLASLTEGPHTLFVIGRDSAVPPNWQLETNATSYAWTVDLTPPVATIPNHPADPTNVTNATFTVGGADVVAYRYRLDGAAWSASEVAASDATTFAAVGEGVHTFEVIGRDLAGNWQKDVSPTTYTWIIDISPHAAVLSGTPAAETNATAIAVTVGGYSIVEYRYALDGASLGAPTSKAIPIAASSLAEGPHTLSVVGRDLAGNWQPDTAPTVYSWLIDLTAPTATLSALPADPTNVSTTAISVAGPGVVKYRFRIDGGGWTGRFDVGAAIALVDLTEATHTLDVVGIDLAGNEDLATPTSFTWTVDQTPPTATLSVSAPSGSPTNDRTLGATVGGADVVEYQYSLDGSAFGAPTPVATTLSAALLAEGPHTLDVIGRDPAGNWQLAANATVFSWTIDLTPPAVATLANLPASLTNVTSLSATVSGTDIVAYVYSLDGVGSAEQAIAAPIAAAGLAQGAHTLSVTGRDAVGNWQSVAASYSWTIDTSANNAVLSNAPSNPTNSTTASITVGGGGVVAYTYRLDGGSWSGEIGTIFPVALNALGDGPHTVEVLAKDGAGNWQLAANATSYTWTVDTLPPTATLSGLPASLTNSAGASITVGGTQVVQYVYALDLGSYGATTSVGTPIALAALIDGLRTVTVLGADAAGNWQSTPTSYSWTVDTQAPTPPAVSDAGATSTTLLLHFTWTNPGDAAEVYLQVATDAGFTTIVYGGVTGLSVGTAQAFDYLADPLNGATYFAHVKVRDAAGNTSAFGAASNGIDIVGGLSGKVKDSLLNNLVGATVRLIRSADSALIAQTTTNATGDFTFANVPVGNNIYELDVSLAGYSNATKNNVTVSAGATSDVGVIYLVPTGASSGRISGTVVNANDGTRLNGATVTVRDWDGVVVRTVTTGATGTFDTNTPNLAPGTYTLTISYTGFFSLSVDNVLVNGNKSVGTQALCEILTEPHVRVVLLWGASPTDLDLHVVGPSNKTVNMDGAPNSRFHVYWANQKSFNENASPNGAYIAGADPTGAVSTTSLVQDATNGYGPEAINLFGYGSGYAHGIFTFTVHKYVTGGTWYDAPVTIRIYDSLGMVREIPVPNGGTLRYWQAFKMDIQGSARAQRTITVVDTFATLTYGTKSSMNW